MKLPGAHWVQITVANGDIFLRQEGTEEYDDVIVLSPHQLPAMMREFIRLLRGELGSEAGVYGEPITEEEMAQLDAKLERLEQRAEN